MNEVFAAALELQTVLQNQQWRFCFIGGIAVQRWGEPRFTDDADVTLLTGFGREDEFVRHLLGCFAPRRPDARDFAIRNRVLLLKNSSGIPLDVALGALDFEVRSVERASPFRFAGGQLLITCSAEDLVVHKCFANRDQDWLDVERTLTRQWATLDLDLVRRELGPLAELKEGPEIITRLEQKVSKLSRSPTLSKLRRR